MSAKVAVISGGSAGIGRAAVIAFAKVGYAVAILARGRERLDSTATEARQYRVTTLPIQIDVADAGQVEAAADRIQRELGQIDVWVNNAMVTIFSPFERITADEYRRVTEVTYLGTVNGTRAALARMRPANRGCIVQVGSALAYRSIPLQSAYCGAKAAIRAFTASLRSELIHDRSGVTLTMVELSAFNTPQFDWACNRMGRAAQPVPPIFQPELAADAIVRAATSTRREWWIGWPAVKAILSARLVPGFGDRYAAHAAYESQLRECEPGSASNLFDAPPGDPGAHGAFDDKAKRMSMQVWLSRYRVAIGVAAVVTAIALAIAQLTMN